MPLLRIYHGGDWVPAYGGPGTLKVYDGSIWRAEPLQVSHAGVWTPAAPITPPGPASGPGSFGWGAADIPVGEDVTIYETAAAVTLDFLEIQGSGSGVLTLTAMPQNTNLITADFASSNLGATGWWGLYQPFGILPAGGSIQANLSGGGLVNVIFAAGVPRASHSFSGGTGSWGGSPGQTRMLLLFYNEAGEPRDVTLDFNWTTPASLSLAIMAPGVGGYLGPDLPGFGSGSRGVTVPANRLLLLAISGTPPVGTIGVTPL